MSPRRAIMIILALAALTGVFFAIRAQDRIEAAYRLLFPLRPANPAATGLVGYWSFDSTDISGTTAIDRSGQGNNGTLTNGPTQTSGQVGGALNFDGSNDFVTVSAPTADGLTSGTIALWVNIDVVDSGNSTCNSHNGSTDCQLLIFSDDIGYAFSVTDDGSVNLDLGDGSSWLVTNTTAANVVTAGRWYHLAVTVSGTTVRYYVDGALQTTNTVAANNGLAQGSNDRLGIGGSAAASSLGIDGSLDDVRIYNRALTENEIRTYYDATSVANRALTGSPGRANSPEIPRTTLTGGLVGYWTFDGPDLIQNATDRSGNGNNGNLTNMATSSAVTPGIHGQALQFDGVNDSIDLGTSINLSGAFTVSTWFNVNIHTTSDFPHLGSININDIDAGDYFIFGTTDSGVSNVFEDFFFGSSDTVQRRVVTSDIQTGQWIHVTVVYNGSGATTAGNWTAYINGTERSHVAATAIGATEGNSRISSRDASGGGVGIDNPYNGRIDDFRVYNRALSAGDVKQLYDRGRPGGASTINASQNSLLANGLVGLWSFDGPDMSGLTTALDRSGNANSGTLTGMSLPNAAIPGIHGQALQLDGTNDYVSIGASASLRIVGAPFSTALWIKTPLNFASNADYQMVSNTDADGRGFLLAINRDISGCTSNNLDLAKSGLADQCVSYTFASDTWYHIAAVQNFSGGSPSNVEYFVNGASIGFYANTTAYNAENSTDISTIGKAYADLNYNRGTLDDVRIYNRALPAAEVKQLYDAGRR